MNEDGDNCRSKWICRGAWVSLHMAVLPFIQGCMFSLGFYLMRTTILPLVLGKRQ